MKILISGSYNSIGPSLAAHFVKEGHDVTVIDGVTNEENARQARQKYKFYNISSSSPECEKIFAAGRFEIVIFIPEDKTISPSRKSLESEDILSGCNVSGLVNMIELSTNNKVKKFVIISSSEIYGSIRESPAAEDNMPIPITLKGMSSYVMEYYCSRWGEMNNLNILSLRVSNIYGPRREVSNYLREEPDEISGFVERLIKGEDIIIKDSGAQTRDFIFIDDLIDGAYKVSVNKNCSGIFNLSSNTERSINSVIENLSKLKKPARIIHQQNAKERIQRSWLDNSKILKAIDWEPKTNFEEGIRITYDDLQLRLKNYRRKRKAQEKVAVKQKKKPVKAIAFIENIILFVLVAFMQWGNLFFNIKLPTLKIDYSIIYIIIMGIMWGQTQAYLAMILSAALYIGMSLFVSADIVTFVYTPENLIRIAAYILVGIVTGYSIERKNRDLESRNLSI